MAEVFLTESSEMPHSGSRATSPILNTSRRRDPLMAPDGRRSRSSDVIRPCYYILQLLGMWRPRDERCGLIWQVYSAFVRLLWLSSLLGIMSLDFVHYGFEDKRIHAVDILNSVPTCLNLLCPFAFAVYYFRRGQFEELLLRVQNTSVVYQERLRTIAGVYTAISVAVWILGTVFFIFHWSPFFHAPWHYVAYITIIVYTTGWWSVWLSIYGFVCHVHSIQIDDVIDCIRSKDATPGTVLFKHQQLQNMLDRTQKDFNVLISLALVYHSIDIISFSFAYFDSAFGNKYKLWQYVGGILFDLMSIMIKLLPPAVVSAGGRRIVVEASKRCGSQVTPLSTSLPLKELQLFQYIACCEQDVGFKILGICITVELTGKIMMTIATAVVSFVAFVVPKLE